MKTILAAIAISMASFNAISSDHSSEGLRYRIDQDSVANIDSNMLWSNNCEFKLNQAVSRPDKQDGKLPSHDDWPETLSILCDHSIGFANVMQ